MQISFSKTGASDEGVLAVGVPEFEDNLRETLLDLDRRSKGAVSRALKTVRFTGARGQVAEILAPAGLDLDRLLLVGIGKETSFGPGEAQEFGATVVARLLTSGEKAATLRLDVKSDDGAELATAAALGAVLRSYRFDIYRTTQKKTDKPSLAKLTVQTADPAEAKKAWKAPEAIARGVFFTRDLVSEPPNVLHPEEFAKLTRKLEELGVEVEILGEK